jgi:hypothetical protein
MAKRRKKLDVNRLQFGEPPPERERCVAGEGKVMFEDEASARAEAERIRQTDGARLDVYWCPHCFKWHFTSAKR